MGGMGGGMGGMAVGSGSIWYDAPSSRIAGPGDARMPATEEIDKEVNGTLIGNVVLDEKADSYADADSRAEAKSGEKMEAAKSPAEPLSSLPMEIAADETADAEPTMDQPMATASPVVMPAKSLGYGFVHDLDFAASSYGGRSRRIGLAGSFGTMGRRYNREKTSLPGSGYYYDNSYWSQYGYRQWFDTLFPALPPAPQPEPPEKQDKSWPGRRLYDF